MENLDMVTGSKSLMVIQNTSLMYFFIIFTIGALIKLFLYRKNSDEVLRNILDVVKYGVCLVVTGSTTLLAQSESPEMVLNATVVTYIAISIVSILIHQIIVKKKNEDKNIEE